MTAQPIDKFLPRLQGVRKNGTGWIALCPAHDDQNPSLSISARDDGTVLLHCHAGCDPVDIVATVGLKQSDLFVPKLATSKRDVAFYIYENEDGTPRHRTVRTEPKGFYQQRPVNGGWLKGLDGMKTVLYRLPELRAGIEANRVIFVAEGEKDVDALRELGVVATTNPMGGSGKGKWRPHHTETLRGARVVILPDNDETGHAHAQAVAAALAPVAASVQVIDLPGLEPKGDPSDWIAAGGDKHALRALVASAPDWEPGAAPAPSPVVPLEDGAGLLDDVRRFVLRFCAFPSVHYVVAVVLWIVHTHAIESFENTPRLAIVGPTKQVGKTRLLEVLGFLCHNPRQAANVTMAYLFRVIAEKKVTVLFDECDATFGRKASDSEKDLQAIVNAGYRRGGTVGRCVGEGAKQVPTEFDVFAPVALAGIGDCLPETIVDRSVVLIMRKRAPGEIVEPLRRRRIQPVADELRDRIKAWAEAQPLKDADPVMPDGIEDRPAEVWEALLAVADAAGGDWPRAARVACTFLNDARARNDDNIGVTLLAAVQVAFGAEEKAFSQTLCDRLNEDTEAPWSGWNDGKGIKPRDLAWRLRPFEIRSKKIRLGEDARQGYELAAFADAWTRYLALPSSGTSGTSGTPLISTVPDVPDVPANEGNVDDVHVHDDRVGADGPLCAECSTRVATRTSGANRPWCAPCWDAALAVNPATNGVRR